MSPFVPGAVLGGRYVLQHLVEDDGLTQSWTATDQVLARPVMVDAMPSETETAARDAFVAAVAGAARLGHPGVVATYDSGVVDGRPYVVTERAAGATLADVVERQGPLAASRAVSVGRQVARALEAAHRVGVIHGGVAPATIVVGEDDRARLGRFAASGTQARLRFGGAGSLAGDIHDLARTLTASVGGSLPRPLIDALAAAQPGGTITTAAAFADALDAIGARDTPAPSTSPSPPRAAPPKPRPPASAPGAATAVLTGLAPTSTRGPADRTPPRPTPAVGAASRAPMVTGIAISAALVAAIAITGFVLVSGSGGSKSGQTPSTGLGGELAVAAAHSFNPLGHPPGQTENEALAPRLVDQDPATVWSTSEYAGARFGNLKPGTGAFVAVTGSRSLHQLTVTSPSRGWVFSVYVAPQAAGDLAGWGQPLGHPVTVTSDVTQVDLGGANGSAVLVWITDLGQALAHPDIPGLPYRVDIGELGVR